MEIIKGLYLNTDKIIIGKEYKVIYKKEIENDEIVDYDNKDLQKYFLQIDKEKYEFEKSEIGYIVKAVFRKEKNKVEVYSITNTEKNNKENRNENRKIHIEEELTAIIEPENLKNIYSQKKQNDLLVIKKSKNIFAFSEQVINAITKAFRSFPKSS
jgi:hypothetical protein